MAPTTQYTAPQVAALALGAGLSPDAAAHATAIAKRESGYRLDALNDNPRTGDYSVGLWQINFFGNLRESRTKRFGTPTQLASSPQLQQKALYDLSAGGTTWGPWTTAKGLSQANLNEGRAAVRTALADQTVLDSLGRPGGFLPGTTEGWKPPADGLSDTGPLVAGGASSPFVWSGGPPGQTAGDFVTRAPGSTQGNMDLAKGLVTAPVDIAKDAAGSVLNGIWSGLGGPLTRVGLIVAGIIFVLVALILVALKGAKDNPEVAAAVA